MHTLEMYRLTGKTALVTGGGHGIGRHICIGLAEAGANVVVVGRKLEPLQEVVDTLQKTGVETRLIQADIGDTDSIDRLIAETDSLNLSIDILINNAGFAWAAPTLEFPMKGWDKVFNLNIRGLFYLSQQYALRMKDNGGGNIINISSISAWRNSTDEEEPVVAYNASKGAVISLTKDLAVKLAEHNIRVNSIAPGSFITTMMQSAKDDDGKVQAMENKIPQKRSGYEDDIKGVAVFLASDASNYITGQTLAVDGGWSCT